MEAVINKEPCDPFEMESKPEFMISKSVAPEVAPSREVTVETMQETESKESHIEEVKDDSDEEDGKERPTYLGLSAVEKLSRVATQYHPTAIPLIGMADELEEKTDDREYNQVASSGDMDFGFVRDGCRKRRREYDTMDFEDDSSEDEYETQQGPSKRQKLENFVPRREPNMRQQVFFSVFFSTIVFVAIWASIVVFYTYGSG